MLTSTHESLVPVLKRGAGENESDESEAHKYKSNEQAMARIKKTVHMSCGGKAPRQVRFNDRFGQMSPLVVRQKKGSIAKRKAMNTVTITLPVDEKQQALKVLYSERPLPVFDPEVWRTEREAKLQAELEQLNKIRDRLLEEERKDEEEMEREDA
jgi:hypothetical protein